MIFEAYAFQDLTGQRIRRAIEHLQRVEALLGGISTPTPEAQPPAPGGGLEILQEDVDVLFG